MPQRPTFPAFPRLEITVTNESQGFSVAAGLIIEGGQFHTQVIALAHLIQTAGQLT